MFNTPVAFVSATVLSTFLVLSSGALPKEVMVFPASTTVHASQTLSEHSISMSDRYPTQVVNDIFKFNILLNADYLAGQKFDQPQKLTMADVDKPLNYSFTLKPGQTFAFHDRVLDKYEGKVALTTNAQFNSPQGFKSDGFLYGDGVCHFASILNWAASDAGLEVEAPTNHDFRVIPGIPKQYGTAILYSGNKAQDAKENLYITNNKDKDVAFNLSYADNQLKVIVSE